MIYICFLSFIANRMPSESLNLNCVLFHMHQDLSDVCCLHNNWTGGISAEREGEAVNCA